MRKIYIVFLFFIFIFIPSCNKSDIEIINMEKINGEYYQNIDKDTIFVSLSDYVVSKKTYEIETEHQDIKIDGTNVYLTNGDNRIIISQRDKKFILNFYKEYDVEIKFIDDNANLFYEFKILANSVLNFDEIKTNIIVPNGYFWDGEVYFNNQEVNISDIKTNESITLVPIFKPLQYQVTVSNELGLFEDFQLSLKTDEKIEFTPLDIPGYTFTGLYANNQLVNEEDVYNPLMGNLFTARYEPKNFKITYLYNNQEKVIEILYGDKIEPFIPSIKGNSFVKWELNGEIFEKQEFTFFNDITLNGIFEPNTYYINYQCIEEPFSEKVVYGTSYKLYIPKKDGFKFLGWYIGEHQFFDGIYEYDYNLTLTAKWKQDKIKLNLETFGGNVDSLSGISSDGYIELPLPEKENYTFIGWYYDIYFKNEVTNLQISEYNNEILYAKYNYDDDYYIDSFVISKFNEHISSYDVLTMFDANQSSFASMYWHKIGVSLIDNDYYISGIAGNGVSLSSLNSYDYVILAYGLYDLYDQFEALDVAVGTKVVFSTDPLLIEDNDVNLLVSFVGKDVSEYYAEITDYLSSTYSKYNEISQNITLIDNYNNFSITWKSSHNEVISSTGIFRKPTSDITVVLSAFIGDTKLYEFSVIAKGGGKSNALATGYIYTPYNTITQNAMNTLDIIYCAFLNFDLNADFTNLTQITNNINNYIKPLALKSGTKIVVSINQSSSGAFSTVAASPTLREKLATNILTFIQNLDIDGVDIDWEVPSSSEIENFTLLMKTIYEKVKLNNPSYLVTAAIGGGKWQPPKYDLYNSPKYMDYINLMTYSMATGNGYYQNALFKSTKKATLVSCSIDESVKIFNDYGIENSKILVGIPFYLTVQTNSGGPGSLTGSGKSVWYNQLETTYAVSDTMKEYFDEECGVPYRYDSVNKIFVSYENEKSIKRKCEYINSLGLAGIMYWQYGQDVNDILSNAIAKYINS